jgi:hypothetical protein
LAVPQALTEQIYSVEMQLDTLKKFEQEKGSMDAELKTLNEAIMREQIQHREAIKSLNRHCAHRSPAPGGAQAPDQFPIIEGTLAFHGGIIGARQLLDGLVCRHAGAIEKDRRDKEEKKAIAKAKQEMLEIQDQHISDVTRRAIDDNNELQLEIAFQSKQAKELLAQNGAYTANAVQVRGSRGSRGAGLRQLCRGTRFGVASADPTRALPCSCGGTWRFRWTRRKRWRRRTARTRRRAALAPAASWRGARTRGILVHPLPRRLRLRAVSV